MAWTLRVIWILNKVLNANYRELSFLPSTLNQKKSVLKLSRDLVGVGGKWKYQCGKFDEGFERIHKFYNCNNAIIQEPCKQQHRQYWNDKLTLNTIEDQLWKYQEKYSNYADVIVDCAIFSGRRRIVDISLW